MSESVEEIVERFVLLRVKKVLETSNNCTNPQPLIEVAKETTATLLKLVNIQFGVFGLRELLSRIRDYIEWETSQISFSKVSLEENKDVMFS